MKIIDWISDKVGDDKIMHFLGGAWVVALGTPFSWCGVIITSILTLALSIVKEQYLDDKFDKWDIVATMIGAAVSALIYLSIYFII